MQEPARRRRQRSRQRVCIRLLIRRPESFVSTVTSPLSLCYWSCYVPPVSPSVSLECNPFAPEEYTPTQAPSQATPATSTGNDQPYFFVFIFANAFPLLTRPFFLSPCLPTAFFSPGRLRTRGFDFTPCSASSFACFFAIRRATRSGSAAFARLRSSFGKCEIRAPSAGLPFGAGPVLRDTEGRRGAGVFVEVDVEVEGLVLANLGVTLAEPGTVLQRCTRSLRFANLSWVSSSARISSTHCRS